MYQNIPKSIAVGFETVPLKNIFSGCVRHHLPVDFTKLAVVYTGNDEEYTA